MTKTNSPHQGPANGFILPLTLGLISLVGLWGTILLEQMHVQSAQLKTSWHEKSLFQKAQKHLERCLTQQQVKLGQSQMIDTCCLVEELTKTKQRSSKTSQPLLYRVSVHHQLVHPINHQILGSVRLQAQVLLAPLSTNISAVSWREIFDLTWERELSRESGNTSFIWDQLPICQHLLQIH